MSDGASRAIAASLAQGAPMFPMPAAGAGACRPRRGRALLAALAALHLPAGFAEPDDAGRSIHALQFGMFFGGSATQYDHCVELGRIEPGPRTAEAMASAYLDNVAPFATDAAARQDAHRGWDIARHKIAEQDAQYWARRCPEIDQQWQRYVESLQLQ